MPGLARSVEVVTIGECLLAFVAQGHEPLSEATSYRRYVAGAEANVAVGLSRLDHGVASVGRVGGDAFGTAILRRLRGEGVDVSSVVVDEEAPTGLLFRERRAVGPSDLVYRRANSAGSRLQPDDVATARAHFATARWLHLTGITPALSESARAAVEAAVAAATEVGMTISLDINLRRKLWPEAVASQVLSGLAGRCDVVFAGVEEGAAVAGLSPDAPAQEVAHTLLALGPGTVVMKLGGGGATSLSRDGRVVSRPAVPLSAVVDPVGAGDAFCAGYLAARLEGLDEAAALDLGNACGAAVVGAEGDTTAAPTHAEVVALRTRAAEESLR